MVENSTPKLPRKRQFKTSLHHGYRDFPPELKRSNVAAIRQNPSGYNAASFQTTRRKNEDDLGAKLFYSVAETADNDCMSSLRHMFHPGKSSTGVSCATIDRRKGEEDLANCAKVGGGSCAYAKPLKNANQAAYIDASTSLASMSQSQPPIPLRSPRMNCTLKQNGHEGCSEDIVGQQLYGQTIPSTDGNKVLDALNRFEVVVTKLSKELEAKPNVKKASVYVKAAMLMKKQQQWVNTTKQFGAVSGVNIGDKFRFRAQLVIIGLHSCWESGIDYMKENGQQLATSIVSSGRYGNDMDSSDVLIYSGQGGNPMVGNRLIEDQKLERGNLALHNSMSVKNPIRVIRGIKNQKGLQKYTYDGLYLVDKFWRDIGKFGKLVFKFLLKRVPAQPRPTRSFVVGQSEFPWRKLNKSKISKEYKGWSLNDMSQGKEKMPIRVFNTIDNEKLPSFDYMTNMIYPEWCKFSQPISCDCSDGCSEKCPCALKNGGEFAFDNNGAIVKAKFLVYECGPSCKCSSACYNRVSQHGIRISLEVFKTESKGWGVRSRNYIPYGSFICEYVGELLRDKDAEGRIGNDEYLFKIGGRDNDTILDDGPISLLDSELCSSNVTDNGGFSIDAAQNGNVARFINHSCSPNLFVQNVLYDHDDWRAPHIMLFATKNIPPLRELTYDYNYVINNLCDSSSNVKIKN